MSEIRSGRPAKPVCEVDRAYRELLGRDRADTAGASSTCSPETPEARDYPSPRAGEPNYFLCNGHLRDLFDELGHAAPHHVAQATSETSP